MYTQDPTESYCSHFFPVWLHQHEKEKPAHLLQSSKTVSASLQVELRELELGSAAIIFNTVKVTIVYVRS